MKVVTVEASVRTPRRGAVVDLTNELAAAVRASGVGDGVACVYSPDPSCRFRFAGRPSIDALDRLLPAGGVIPVQRAELQHGPSRRVVLVELDRGRDRRWIVQIVGD